MSTAETSVTAPAPAPAQRRNAEHDDFFGIQLAHSADLPDPEPLLVGLTRSALEVMAGAREAEQLLRWVTQDVYVTLLKRSVLAARAREVKGVAPRRPQFAVLRTRVTHPCDGVVEGVVIVENPVRVRAVAIRLEGMDGRWRASAISVL